MLNKQSLFLFSRYSARSCSAQVESELARQRFKPYAAREMNHPVFLYVGMNVWSLPGSLVHLIYISKPEICRHSADMHYFD